MSGRTPPATRQQLLALGRRLERVGRGSSLLRRKREALVTELFRLARPAATGRRTIADRAAVAYPLLADALAEEGAAELRSLAWPGRDLRLMLNPREVWGTAVAEIVDRPPLRRTLGARGTPPASLAPATAAAATAFEEFADALLEAANREALLRRLGDALARTSRQVNTLERRLEPTLRGQLLAVARTLAEREREEHVRTSRLLRRHAAAATNGRGSP